MIKQVPKNISSHTYYNLEIDGSGSKRTDGNTSTSNGDLQ